MGVKAVDSASTLRILPPRQAPEAIYIHIYIYIYSYTHASGRQVFFCRNRFPSAYYTASPGAVGTKSLTPRIVTASPGAGQTRCRLPRVFLLPRQAHHSLKLPARIPSGSPPIPGASGPDPILIPTTP